MKVNYNKTPYLYSHSDNRYKFEPDMRKRVWESVDPVHYNKVNKGKGIGVIPVLLAPNIPTQNRISQLNLNGNSVTETQFKNMHRDISGKGLQNFNTNKTVSYNVPNGNTQSTNK